MCGGILVMKFKEGDNLIRIASDNVPYDKQYIFNDLRSILTKHIDKDNIIAKV